MSEPIEILFFDTYAFFEIIKGNSKYEKYKNTVAITTIFNLAELNYGLKKELSLDVADRITEKYSEFLVELNITDIKKAMTFRRIHKDLSIPDSIGYIVAQKHRLKFLTGDDDFKDLPNVEFVKK